MQFHAAGADDRPEPELPRASPFGRGLLLLGSGLSLLAASQPWTRVAFPRLWGAGDGPRGYDTVGGMTCSITCALVVVTALFGDRSPATRQAVAPGALLLSWLAVSAMALQCWHGAGSLRGGTAEFTAAFALGFAGAVLAALACTWRWRQIAPRRRSGRAPT